ncbi:hypothetical protein [Agaribacterium haliotis]|uniref:hypothetical protein n=1 Tax=Agaribacterium haliotis TaxID=2013869 RepID=UPI000BB56C60|nr:hypothetical protein [Agaribacterium haliotis]
MKIIFFTFGVLMSCLASSVSFANAGKLKGKVEYIRIHDAENASWVPPIFWFSVEGVTNAGNCGLWQGRPIFVGNSSEMLSILLAAQMADREISFQWDDAVLTNGKCRVGYVTTGNPPPLF